MSASASEASESANEALALASANAAAQQQKGLAARRAAAANRMAAKPGKKKLKPSESKDRHLAKHEKEVAKISMASFSVLITMISLAQLVKAANITESNFDISKLRELAMTNANINYEKKKNNHWKIIKDMAKSGEANYKLVVDGKCDPFNNEQQPQAPFGLGYWSMPVTDVQNDADVKACLIAISHNMNVKETSVHKAYSAIMSNMAMMQLAHVTLSYRKIHNDLNTDATLHGSLFKLAKEAGFEAHSESYFKSIVLASEAYYELATTFHLLRYATIAISTWRSEFRMIRAALCDAKNDDLHVLLVSADVNENEDDAQRRIDNFLAQK